MIPSRQKFRMAGLIASAAFACAAFAQAPQPSSAAPVAQPQAQTQAAPAEGKKAQRMDRAQRMERMQARHAQRLAELKQKLRLESSQEGAWNSFTAAQQRPARPAGQARMEREAFAKLTTPQRLERMQARQAERSARFTQRIEATRSFYATLSPEQQKTFDAETLHFGHRGHGPHQHHGKGEPAKS